MDTAIPALLTALHLTMAILRRHRAAGRSIVSPLVLPSFLFTLAPWLWPTPFGLVAGVAMHVAWFLVCELLAPAAPATTPKGATPAPRTPRSQAHHSPGFATTTVLAVLDEASEVKTFRLARPEGFDFLPGQFLPVRVQIDGKPHVRCYSISSAPHARGYLEISVRRQGLVSGTLHATVRAGSTLAINRPAGRFAYPEGDDRPLVLIAGGIGITPLVAMLRHAVAVDPTRMVTLLYCARRDQDVAFHHELCVLAERHPLVHIVITLTQPDRPTPLHTGRIDAEMFRRHVPNAAHTIFCLCGPGPMVAQTREVLAHLGVPAGQVRFEQFETAVAASQLNAASGPDPGDGPPGDDVCVTFASSGRSVSASVSRTLLEIAEAEGVAIPSLCRSGVCQSCRTRLTGGTADCRSTMLDAGDRADGFILPCVSWPTGDCVLEA